MDITLKNVTDALEFFCSPRTVRSITVSITGNPQPTTEQLTQVTAFLNQLEQEQKVIIGKDDIFKTYEWITPPSPEKTKHQCLAEAGFDFNILSPDQKFKLERAMDFFRTQGRYFTVDEIEKMRAESYEAGCVGDREP